jgi:EAL domain-containing protein (putative c-di-GMP-specific phosphodiesterase class I)
VEALLRWRHPERGLLLPELFLHAAEQSTVGDELTDWVVQELGRHATAWRAAGLRPLTGINVSPHQLRTRDFTARLLAELESHDLNPRDFVVELTESAWTVDALGTLTAIQGLQTAGVALAIDDFGTGYSSLARLRQLEFDYLKVDRELLRDVPADPTAVAVMRAILDLGRACSSQLIVEGVESETQRGFLETQGVRLAQGFHLGRPQQHAEAGELLERFLVRQGSSSPARRA